MEETFQVVICGDNYEVLKDFPDNYFDSIVTDSPYGLGVEPDIVAVLKDWLETGHHDVSEKKGFMNKKWDAFVPQPIFWKEVYRVLKHGGHVASFFGTRTYDLGVIAMRIAGFEIRDRIQWYFDDSEVKNDFVSSLSDEQKHMLSQIMRNGDNEVSWVYGSGFPKSHNISKAIDKSAGLEREIISTQVTKSGGMQHVNKANKEQGYRADAYNPQGNVINNTIPASDAAREWEGWGTSLKPANEPIVLARKPLIGTVVENITQFGTGGINIDACRVEAADSNDDNDDNELSVANSGRFPANIILSHHADCVCDGTKKVKGSNCKPSDIGKGREGSGTKGIYGALPLQVSVSHTDEEGMETVEAWTCHDDCPLKIMDEQKPNAGAFAPVKSGSNGKSNGVYGNYSDHGDDGKSFRGELGGASRFFYCAKASKSEKNFGLPEDHPNTHITVKPIALMRYVVKLVTPVGGITCDTFGGSGGTGVAAKLEGINCIVIEQNKYDCETSEMRIAAWGNEMKKESKSQLNLF